MSPRPRRQPMIPCPHCGKGNDPERGSTLCWSCHKPLRGEALAVYRDAVAGAARILDAELAHIATLTDREAAERAHAPGGPTVDELESRIRALRDRTRGRAAA